MMILTRLHALARTMVPLCLLAMFACVTRAAEVGSCYSPEEFARIVDAARVQKKFEWEWICDYPGGECDYTEKDTSSGEWAEELIYSGLMSHANFDFFVQNLMRTRSIDRGAAEKLQLNVHEYIYLSLKEVGALTYGRALFATADGRSGLYVAYDRPTYYFPQRICVAATLSDLVYRSLPMDGVKQPPTDAQNREACERYRPGSCWPWKKTFDEIEPPEKEALFFGRLSSMLSTRKHPGFAVAGAALVFTLSHNQWGRTRIHGYVVHSSGMAENESMGFFPRAMR